MDTNTEKLDNQFLDDLINQDLVPADKQAETAVASKDDKEMPLIERLNPAEKQVALKLAKEIDTNNPDSIQLFGVKAQQKISHFSDNVLAQVQKNDVSEIGNTLGELMYEITQSDPSELSVENQTFLSKMFKKAKRSIFELTNKYQSLGAQIDKIAVKLDMDKNKLAEDNKMLTSLYNENLDYYNALNVYIAAAEEKMKEIADVDIPKALAKAQETGDQMDAQIVKDLTEFNNRLEKRAYDLKLARQITIQQAPQIRLIQNTNQVLISKVDSSINTAIPLWKNQIVIALTLLKQKDVAATQKKVTDTTNELLSKNSEMLKQTAIETAKESERGIVDIETLQKTQQDLIETIEQTLEIQKDGREKRQLAEKELNKMEEELKGKLLELAEKGATGQADVGGAPRGAASYGHDVIDVIENEDK